MATAAFCKHAEADSVQHIFGDSCITAPPCQPAGTAVPNGAESRDGSPSAFVMTTTTTAAGAPIHASSSGTGTPSNLPASLAIFAPPPPSEALPQALQDVITARRSSSAAAAATTAPARLRPQAAVLVGEAEQRTKTDCCETRRKGCRFGADPCGTRKWSCAPASAPVARACGLATPDASPSAGSQASGEGHGQCCESRTRLCLFWAMLTGQA